MDAIERELLGLCRTCDRKVRPGMEQCIPCKRPSDRPDARTDKAAYMRWYRAKRREVGGCQGCRNSAEPGKNWCAECLAKKAQYDRDRTTSGARQATRRARTG